VLTEYSTRTGNFPQVTRVLLKKIAPGNSKMSYIYDSQVFHYIVRDNITFLCMADEKVSRQVAFKYLEAIRLKFEAAYGDIRFKLIAYSIDADFKRVLRQEMDLANISASRGGSKILAINEDLDQAKKTLYINIDKVLERGSKIELLVDKSDNLNAHANQFRKTSKKLKRRLWWQNLRYMFMIFAVVLLIIYIIVAMPCGFKLNDC